MLIAQRLRSHIRQLDGAFGTGVHKPVAADGMKLSSCYDLSQLLHIRGFDVNNIEAFILYVEIPEIYSQIITAYECFSVAVHRDAIDVVGMRIGVRLSRDSRNNGVMVG